MGIYIDVSCPRVSATGIQATESYNGPEDWRGAIYMEVVCAAVGHVFAQSARSMEVVDNFHRGQSTRGAGEALGNQL